MDGSRGASEGGTSVSKKAASTVQRLRFMRVKENEFYRKEQQKLQQQQNERMEWCATGWENTEDLYRAQVEEKQLVDMALNGVELSKKLPTSSIVIQGRRSYGNANPCVDGFVRKINHKIYTLKVHLYHEELLEQYGTTSRGEKLMKKKKR